MANLSEMNMSELIARHNELAVKLNVGQETTFKSLAAAREAVESLEKKEAGGTTEVVQQPVTEGVAGVATGENKVVDPQKYNTSDKRGPNQGIGAYAKERILAGKTNKEILEEINVKFPTARTSASCIAYYRSALKKGDQKQTTPADLRIRAGELAKEAQDLLIKAQVLEDESKAAAEAAAMAEQQAKEEAAKVLEAAQKASASVAQAAADVIQATGNGSAEPQPQQVVEIPPWQPPESNPNPEQPSA